MAEMKKLSLAIFETPEYCEYCPCGYYTEGSSFNYCQLKAYIEPNVHFSKWCIEYGNEPIPDWCPLKPVVFEEEYTK